MGAQATHRTRPPDRRATDDVLGDEEPGTRTTSRRILAPAACLALGAALALAATLGDGPHEPVAPSLVLRAGELVPRDRPVGERFAEAAMHVEVVNTGDRTLVLRHAELVPGPWAVDVVDRPRLVPGESAVLSLHRTVACDERASYGPAPEHLVVEASSLDDTVVVRMPVDDPTAYGGRLGDALRDPGRACVVTGGDVGGPLGDVIGSWRARRTG